MREETGLVRVSATSSHHLLLLLVLLQTRQTHTETEQSCNPLHPSVRGKEVGKQATVFVNKARQIYGSTFVYFSLSHMETLERDMFHDKNQSFILLFFITDNSTDTLNDRPTPITL